MATAKQNPPDSDDEIKTSTPQSSPTASAAVSVDDDLRRRYLEALERKRAGGSAAATGHGADRATAPTSNDKVKRTFRRRAGG